MFRNRMSTHEFVQNSNFSKEARNMTKSNTEKNFIVLAILHKYEHKFFQINLSMSKTKVN